MKPNALSSVFTMLLGLTVSTLAAIQSPLHIGTVSSIIDEKGAKLAGSDPTAAQFGQPVVLGDMVHIIQTFDGAIHSPAASGLPIGTNNSIISTTRIGSGVDPAAGQTGQFGLTLPEYSGGTIFARVFNSPQLADASFYADSQLYSPSSGYSQFIPTMTSVQPLDGADDDNDGLNNSWEKSLGTNPNLADTDGDGIKDYDEFLSGTDGTDSNSYLKMVQVLPALNGDAIIYWASIPGKKYSVEFNAGSLEIPNFLSLGSTVTATGTTAQIVHSGALTNSTGHYRVKFVP